MTATSQPKRGLIRLTSMETLGFLEAPGRTWTTPPSAGALPTRNGESDGDATGLVTLPVGRHSRHAERTGELVKDIWESTDLNAPSLVDWAPQSFGTKHLGTRRFRWPMLLVVIVLGAAIAGAALWLYREPDNTKSTALEQVRAEAETLSTALSDVTPLVDDLSADRLPESNRDATVFFELGESARALFAASADLPTDDSTDRSAAAEAAGLAIEASRQLMDATAYRTALEPALALPELETDPDLTDLPSATEAFTQWRVSFDSVRSGLPAAIATETSPALEEISAELEATQTAYLDALRTDNRTAAVEVLGMLRANLQSARQALLADTAAVAEAVSGMIEKARTEVDGLLG